MQALSLKAGRLVALNHVVTDHVIARINATLGFLKTKRIRIFLIKKFFFILSLRSFSRRTEYKRAHAITLRKLGATTNARER